MAKTTEQLIIELVLKVDKAVAGFNGLAQGTDKYNQQLLKTIALMNQLSTSSGKGFPKIANMSVGNNPALLKDIVDTKNAISDGLVPALDKIPPKTHNAAQGFNVLRTAMGFLTAMALSAIAQGIMSMFKKIIDSASQAEQAFIKLAIAEKSISQLGVDITPTELTDIIDKVAKAYESVSKIDAQKMVSSLAVLTKDLKLSAKEYEKLAMAIPLVAQQAGVTIDNATNQVITGLTKSGRGWADLGITVDAEIIRQKAVSAGIVKTREEYEALNAEQKQQVEVLALLQILEDNTINNKAEQEKYNNSLAGSQKALNAEWEDFAKSLGTFAAPTIIQFLQALTKTLVTLNEWTEKNANSVNEWAANFAGISAIYSEFMSNIKTLGIGSSPSEYANTFMEAYLQAKKYQDDLKMGTDTPTAPQTPGSGESNQNILDAEKKFNEEILEAQIKLGQDLEDAKIDWERKLVDISIEYANKRKEVDIDYANKVADINRDYADKIADIKQKQQEAQAKHRQDEINKEQEFQNKLQEMKENYLLSLDDALHNRDARQILKLQKQYELDKLQAERKHALDVETSNEEESLRQQSSSREIKKAAEDRDRKLADAQRDYANKIAALERDKQAEIAAANLAYQRKQQDLERAMQDRLEVVAANLVQEFNLTKAGLDAIAQLYLKYYANVSAIYAAMQGMLNGMSMLGGSPTISPLGGKSGGGARPGVMMAEGGSFIANRPTTVTFGEAGMEMASFMPMGRVGKDVNSLFSNVSSEGSGGAGGNVSIELLLSPDLESRIVSNTLNKTAEVIMRTQRSR